ncbi:methyltransferase [Histoplasma capsulatum]|uniref:Methyltransferase n=1 Tax=Ajellomyces capsulatus TaxID=5037 RepID=A0A8A1M5S9_AJECA|nr:methyltransferase [Histoplasma capsulatum]
MKADVAGSFLNVPHFAIRQSSACSARQFMSLMSVLSRQRVRLSVLEFGPLTYSVFEEDLEPVQEVFTSLKKLVFYLSTIKDTPWRPKAQAYLFGSEGFCDVVDNGKAIKLLSISSLLTHLSSSTKDAPFRKEANFKSFVANYTWLQLKCLSIGNLVASENDTIHFLSRHRLEELSIRSITLQGSWIAALPAMREAASPTLDQAIAYEWITNETGESWYLGLHPAKSIVGRSDETSLGLHVAYYLSKAPNGYPCPLTLSNTS